MRGNRSGRTAHRAAFTWYEAVVALVVGTFLLMLVWQLVGEVLLAKRSAQAKLDTSSARVELALQLQQELRAADGGLIVGPNFGPVRVGTATVAGRSWDTLTVFYPRSPLYRVSARPCRLNVGGATCVRVIQSGAIASDLVASSLVAVGGDVGVQLYRVDAVRVIGADSSDLDLRAARMVGVDANGGVSSTDSVISASYRARGTGTIVSTSALPCQYGAAVDGNYCVEARAATAITSVNATALWAPPSGSATPTGAYLELDVTPVGSLLGIARMSSYTPRSGVQMSPSVMIQRIGFVRYYPATTNGITTLRRVDDLVGASAFAADQPVLANLVDWRVETQRVAPDAVWTRGEQFVDADAQVGGGGSLCQTVSAGGGIPFTPGARGIACPSARSRTALVQVRYRLRERDPRNTERALTDTVVIRIVSAFPNTSSGRVGAP